MWRNAFWVFSLGIIAAYLFFFALGAFRFDDSLVLSISVIVLAVAWGVHVVLESHRVLNGRDQRLVHARERRGF